MGELVWDDRLLPRARAYELAGCWPVAAVRRRRPGAGYELHLCCGAQAGRRRCGQSVLRLAGDGGSYLVTVEAQLAAVLRHMVMAHDVLLSGAGRGGDGRGDAGRSRADGQAAGGAGAGGRGGRPGAAGGRPADQEGDHRGGGGPSGGDCA